MPVLFSYNFHAFSSIDRMNSASFYAPLKKRVEIKLPAEHSDDDLGLSSDEDELKEYLPGERETDEEDESDMDMEKLFHGVP